MVSVLCILRSSCQVIHPASSGLRDRKYNDGAFMKKIALIITSVILFAACETNHTCECKYTYWGFTGDLESGASYIFKSGETPCEYFEGKDTHEEVDAFDHIGDKYYECKEVD